MISFSQVYKRYPGGHEALKNLSFTIEAGEMAFITGPTGAGKSTLLKLVAAIEKPSSGSVVVSGQNIGKLRRSAVPYLRRNFGLVFQDHKLLYDRNVLENVILPLDIAGLPRAEGMKRARAALDKVKLLGLEKASPISLSGGEQQRLCVARAIVNRPTIVLADEPTGNLDAEYAGEIMEMFKSFNQVGVTLLIATHDESLITRYSSRVLHLKQGELS
ncbi:cell division ATP-binding protein FtsE [Sulfuricella denitrificans skB26]|uniref:Cell division ATP-binding protein FtsE n=1 Tax=Sulfuricella denitrificans (strain DSM 22764 / NBRC 105220 / skB26) TaxID=1163617 RepID=S6ANJ0_SULDS|nr:cell division ATP-binding protein FtsE [Sulfuricella denitrificans]BAN36439.1 cell division ATP-binding protein FtsE [Sulfuricella denitrificans skB26]